MDFTRSSRMNICIFKEGKGHCSPLSHPQSFSLYCLFFKAFALRVQKLSPLYYDFQGVFLIAYTSMNKKESTLKILCQNQDRNNSEVRGNQFLYISRVFLLRQIWIVKYCVKYSTVDCKYLHFLQDFFFRLKPKQYKKCQYCRLLKKHLETHKTKQTI